MSKKKIIVLVSFCVLFAFLLLAMLAGSAALLLLGNTQGLIGELLSGTELPPLFERLPSDKEQADQSEPTTEQDSTPPEPAGDVIGIESSLLEDLPPDVIIGGELDKVETLPDEMYDYFDFTMTQIPTYAGFSRVHKGMRLELVINIMGKPHRYIHLTEESVVLLWNTDTQENVTIKVTFGQGEYQTEEDRWNDARVTDVIR